MSSISEKREGDLFLGPDVVIVKEWFCEENKIFKFRKGCIPRGQYEFPFTFRIPEIDDLPSTFSFSNADGETF